VDKITFPIIGINKNQIMEKSGKSSYFFELTPPDLSSKTSREVTHLMDMVGLELNSLDETKFFKFYSLGGKRFLNTNQTDLKLPQVIVSPYESPLQIFFGNLDIYSDVEFYDDYINFNGNYKRILSVLEFSSKEMDTRFIREDLDYVLLFERKSKEKATKQLERIRSAHQANFAKGKRDVESEGTYFQAEDLISDLTSGLESLFVMELYFILSAYSLKELNEQTLALIDQGKALEFKLFIEGQSFKKLKTGLPYLFNQLIPGVYPTFKHRQHTDKTSHLKFLLPMDQSFLMDKGIEFSDVSGKTIYFDPFLDSLKNKNMLVTGSSGGGKSVLVNMLVHHLIKDHPTVILDKGGSFRKLTLYHEGVELKQKFNPMQFRNPEFLREIILSVVDLEKFNKLEKGKLLKVIREHLEDITLVNFDELIIRLEQDFSGIGYYFEDLKEFLGKEDIDPHKILYVDVEEYPKEAISPLIIFLLEYFKNLKEQKKILVFDECWSFLKGHADYIDDCFRTFRKTGALPIAISQGLKDFHEIGDLYNSISNNSYFKAFFPQDFIDDPNIDEFDNEMIKSLNFEKGSYSECYLKSSDNKYRKVLRIELTPLELELFHTEAQADDPLRRFINDNRQYFKSNKDVIDAFMRLKTCTK